MSRFLSEGWIKALSEKLNTDEQYAAVAKNWEGDLLFFIEPGGALEEEMIFYLDLWHGTCRKAYLLAERQDMEVAFSFSAPFGNIVRILKGEWHPMQAMMTRRLQVRGDMIYMMRNLPTVLEFVRCCQEVTTSIIGDD